MSTRIRAFFCVFSPIHQPAVLADFRPKGISVRFCCRFSVYRLVNDVFKAHFALFCSPVCHSPPDCREHSNPRVASASQASHLPVVLTRLPPYAWPDRSIIVPYAPHGRQTMPSGLYGISVDRSLGFPGHRARMPAAPHIRKVIGMLYMKLSMSNQGIASHFLYGDGKLQKCPLLLEIFLRKFPFTFFMGTDNRKSAE